MGRRTAHWAPTGDSTRFLGAAGARREPPESHPEAQAIHRRVELKVVRGEEIPPDAPKVRVPDDAR